MTIRLIADYSELGGTVLNGDDFYDVGLTDTLDVTLGYAYNHGKYADFEEGDCWIGTPWHTGLEDPGKLENGFCDRSGGDISSNPEKEDGSYNLFNLRAGLIYEPWDAEVVLWGRNLFDEEYVTTIADKVAQDGNFLGYPTPTTTWGITARKHF